MVLGHVVIFSKEVYCRLGYLDVEVVVPWEDLGAN